MIKECAERRRAGLMRQLLLLLLVVVVVVVRRHKKKAGLRLNRRGDASSSFAGNRSTQRIHLYRFPARPHNHRVHFLPLVFPSEPIAVALRCFYPDDESIYISLIASPFVS